MFKNIFLSNYFAKSQVPVFAREKNCLSDVWQEFSVSETVAES